MHCTGDLAAFDADTLAPVGESELSATTAEGNEVTATMKGNVSVHVHGAGAYVGDNRVVTFTDVYYIPGLPSWRRVISAGYLESSEHQKSTGMAVAVNPKESCIEMHNAATREPVYTFAMAKDYTWYIPGSSAVGAKPAAQGGGLHHDAC